MKKIRKAMIAFLVCTLITLFSHNAAVKGAEENAEDVTWRVLVIAIDPEVNYYGQKMRTTEYLGFDIDESITSLKNHIYRGSNGMVNVKVVDTIRLNEFPKYVEYDSLTDKEFFQIYPSPNSFWEWTNLNQKYHYISAELDGGFHFDYDYLINKCDLIDKRNHNDFDMVWVFSIDPSSMYEANTIGRGYVASNGPHIEKDCDNFLLLGLSFSRKDGAIESFCHAFESILNQVYSNTTTTGNPYGDMMIFDDLSKLNMWEKFRYCKIAGDSNDSVYGVGMVHYSPNSTKDYDWENATPVKSYYEDFKYNYPNIGTSVTLFTPNSTYLPFVDSACESHHEWWLSLMPHYLGRDNQGYLNNWWEYIFTCDPTVGLCFQDDTNTKEIVLDKDHSVSDISLTVKLASGKTKKINLSDTTFYTEGKGRIGIDDGTIKALKPGNEKIEILYDGYHVQLLINIPCNHENTIEVDRINADCEKAGYTSGIYCRDCEEYILGHEEIMPHHKYEILKNQNEICSVKCKQCGYECKALYISEEKECGDTIKFGSYEQNNLLSDGKEEIEWLILEKTGDKYLLLSKYCLEALPYNNENTSISWKECSLRKWLNTDFLKTAFTDMEQETIRQTNGDAVFLPSTNEIDKYFKTEHDRIAKASDYAIANGAWNSGGYCCWWLMQSTYSKYAPIVDAYGPVFSPGNAVIYVDDCVRPMIWINYYKEPEYAVEVINGTGTGEYLAGDKVSITAEQKEGYKFIKWEVTSGNIDLVSSTKDTTSFTMVAEDIKIEALYEAISYSVKVKSSKNGVTMVNKSNATVGEQLTFLAMPKKGYRLKEWIVLEGSAEIISENKNSIKIKMPANNVIVEAVYEAISY